MRSLPVAAGGALLVLLLSGCGSEAGPTPKQGGGEPGPDALPTKLAALSADQCFASPRTQLPKGCEKYVTELAGVAGALRKRAGDDDPPLGAQADALDRGITAFRGAGCTTVPDPGGACSQALSDIAATVTTTKQLLSARPTTG